MPCLELLRPHAGIVCTTHLLREQIDPAAHAAQVSALLRHADEQVALHADVVIGGDFNTAVEELDASGYLHGARRGSIDGVLASNRAYRSLRAETFGCRCSDHDAVVVALERR